MNSLLTAIFLGLFSFIAFSEQRAGTQAPKGQAESSADPMVQLRNCISGKLNPHMDATQSASQTMGQGGHSWSAQEKKNLAKKYGDECKRRLNLIGKINSASEQRAANEALKAAPANQVQGP